MEGLMLLVDSVGKEKRPLSWVIGPQGVIKPERPSMRDLKQPQRQQATVLRPMDEV
jgi:NADH-quinone oxidoreductase subunit B